VEIGIYVQNSNQKFRQEKHMKLESHIYPYLSQQNKKDMNNFTVNYANDFSHGSSGIRDKWFSIDLIYAGEWKGIRERINTKLERSFIHPFSRKIFHVQIHKDLYAMCLTHSFTF